MRTRWKDLTDSERLWFARHMSTGCGSDSWKRGCCLIKNLIDDWWEVQACLEHDWEYFAGGDFEDKQKADWMFLYNTWNATPWNIPGVIAAYSVVSNYDKWDLRIKPYGRGELRMCIKERARRKELKLSPIVGAANWMTWLENQRY